MKKVLLFSAPFRYYRGGSEYQYQLIEQALRERFRLYYLFQRPPGEEKVEWREAGVTMRTYTWRYSKGYNPYQYREIPNILEHVAAIAPDVIYKRGVNYITAAAVYYARKNAVRSICHLSSEADVTPWRPRLNRQAPFDWFNRRLAAYSLKYADAVICQTDNQSQLLSENHQRSADAIIRNFHPLPEGDFEKNGPFTIVWTANFKRMKHPELFLDLAERLRHKPYKWIMIGRPAKGKWQEELQKRIDQLPKLQYLGEQPIKAVEEILASAHLFVNTSDYEGMPNTFIQAWMREVPVLSLAVDPDGLISRERIGRVSGSFSKLIDDARELSDNNQLRREMGQMARRFAAEAFSLQNIQKLEEIFGGQ